LSLSTNFNKTMYKNRLYLVETGAAEFEMAAYEALTAESLDKAFREFMSLPSEKMSRRFDVRDVVDFGDRRGMYVTYVTTDDCESYFIIDRERQDITGELAWVLCEDGIYRAYNAEEYQEYLDSEFPLSDLTIRKTAK